jgi:hypothetical protein
MEYKLFCDCFAVFSNLLKTQYIQILADADVHEAVQEVQVRIGEDSLQKSF